MSRRGRPLCALHALLLAIAVLHTVSGAAAGGIPKKKYLFWTDYPGSATWKVRDGAAQATRPRGTLAAACARVRLASGIMESCAVLATVRTNSCGGVFVSDVTVVLFGARCLWCRFTQSKQPSWWDLIEVKNGSSFTSVDDVSVEVNWDDHKAIHLYADPSFLKGFDEIIAHANGPLSSTMTGTIDECGWPVRVCEVAATRR